MKKRKFVVAGGYWSTNIGNSFFQLGTQHLLKTLFPDDDVILMSDQPGYWQPGRKSNPRNALLLLNSIEVDYLVIQGPVFRPDYEKIWLETLRNLHARGVKIIMLAAGMMDYQESTAQRCRNWLSETPPFVFTTRDSITYELFHDIPIHSYDGVDVALYITDWFQPPATNLGDYVILNFDKGPEPRIWLEESKQRHNDADQEFTFDGDRWYIEFPKLRKSSARFSRLTQFVDSWIPSRLPETIDGYTVVRTDHRFNPVIVRRMYRGPNTLVSDIPEPYLTLYANAKLTLSNRVHACLAALAYGNHAMLFSSSPRSMLLERIGVKDITKRPQRLDLDYVDEEKTKLISFLEAVLKPEEGDGE